MKGTKTVSEKTMLALRLDETRGQARELVRKSEYQCGSRMVAYERVGQIIGASGMWVRKLIHGYGDVRLLHVTAMNIQDAYVRLCERVERATEHERDVARALERQIHAATSGAAGVVDRSQSSAAASSKSAPDVDE